VAVASLCTAVSSLIRLLAILWSVKRGEEAEKKKKAAKKIENSHLEQMTERAKIETFRIEEDRVGQIERAFEALVKVNIKEAALLFLLIQKKTAVLFLLI
jgi:hypothetical protein